MNMHRFASQCSDLIAIYCNQCVILSGTHPAAACMRKLPLPSLHHKGTMMKTKEMSFAKNGRKVFSATANKLLKCLVLTALVAPGAALAEEASPFSVNIGLTTDYLFRGISQTSRNPALQGGIDYTHTSGLYAGMWGSNISWIRDFNAGVSSSMELDTYFGFRDTLENEFSYDVGFIRYNYPASGYAAGATKADTNEVYIWAGYKWISVKYSYGLGDFLTVTDARGTDYIELNASVPLGDSGFTFGVHAGKQGYKGASADALALVGTSATYSDYRLSLAGGVGDYTVSMVYSDTDSRAGGFYTTPAGQDLARGAVVLSVTRAF